MPLMPKRVRYRKQQRGRRAGKAQMGIRISFGEFWLQELERAWITNTQIEACRVAINRSMKRRGRLWVRIFPDKPVSKKPLETRMGKGKGEPEFWAAVIRPGMILYEIGGVTEDAARICFARLAHKMPLRVRFVKRRAM